MKKQAPSINEMIARESEMITKMASAIEDITNSGFSEISLLTIASSLIDEIQEKTKMTDEEILQMIYRERLGRKRLYGNSSRM